MLIDGLEVASASLSGFDASRLKQARCRTSQAAVIDRVSKPRQH